MSNNMFGDGFFKSMGLPNFAVPNFTLPGFAEGASNPFQKLTGFVMPTINVEELDKKISDLKSVEQWIDTQQSLLRATVQALEVQRNTLVMLKSFGAPTEKLQEVAEDMRGSGLPSGWPAPAAPAAASPASPTAVRTAWPHQPVPEPDSNDELDDSEHFDGEMPPDNAKPVAASPVAQTPHAPDAGTPDKKAGNRKIAAESASIASATAWWKLLQDQFTQVAGAAARPSAAVFSTAKATAAKSTAAKPGAPSKAPAKRATRAATKSAQKPEAGKSKSAGRKSASSKVGPPATVGSFRRRT
jgi:hypothetical protein